MVSSQPCNVAARRLGGSSSLGTGADRGVFEHYGLKSGGSLSRAVLGGLEHPVLRLVTRHAKPILPSSLVNSSAGRPLNL